jgi:hypothetical protein
MVAVSRSFRYVTPTRRQQQGGKLVFKSGAAVFGQAWREGTWNKPAAAAAPTSVVPFPVPDAPVAPAPVDPVSELRNAEAGLREAVRVYNFARREIADANRSHTDAVIANGMIAIPAKPYTAERRRERRAAAFRLFNKRRAQLITARRRLDAVRLALDLPLSDAEAAPLLARVLPPRI